MKIISLNVRGLEGKAKLYRLRSLLHSLRPYMVLLQETMCSTFPALFAFSKLFPSWEYYAIDAKGLSGGLLSAWDPLKVRCRAYHTCVGILLQASFRGLTYPLSIINTYGPYKN